MKKAVAVQGFTYEISDATVMATVVLTGVPSLKLKSAHMGACLDQFSAIISVITKTPATIPDPGPYTVNFSATALKLKDGMKFVLRVDDVTGDIIATPQVPGNPPSPSPCTFHLKITDAGQTKLRSN